MQKVILSSVKRETPEGEESEEDWNTTAIAYVRDAAAKDPAWSSGKS